MFGRFESRYRNGGLKVKITIVRFAARKLIASERWSKVLSDEQKLGKFFSLSCKFPRLTDTLQSVCRLACHWSPMP